MLWLHRWPRACATLLLAAGFVALAVEAPALMRAWCAKEGPVEAGSHVVLLAAALVWLGSWRRGGARALGMAVYLLIVLGEELDWGAVLGASDVALRLDASFGRRNLHNLARGSSYLLFALPLLLHFVAPARWHGRLAPLRDERAAFLAIAALFIAFNLGPWEREAQEVLEAALYALLLVCGLRLWRA